MHHKVCPIIQLVVNPVWFSTNIVLNITCMNLVICFYCVKEVTLSVLMI